MAFHSETKLAEHMPGKETCRNDTQIHATEQSGWRAGNR